tara:strand:+ start:74 stop:679 length:606 start_codon:yes stop_codon:yes gene_type:complete
MSSKENNFSKNSRKYLYRLHNIFDDKIFNQIESLAKDLLKLWREERNLFICGNGGSAANAMHMANDFHYGIGACGEKPFMQGLKVEALPSNPGIITCLANDTGYENIYSHQLINKAKKGDILIALSGSGNSANICKALETAFNLQLYSYAILGYSGGKCLNLADCAIHFPINDMQIAEDTQLIVGHLCMQWLTKNKPYLKN